MRRHLADQARNSVGASYASYHLNGHQWALAVDAATPVAAARPDVLAARGFAVLGEWAEVLEVARAGLVAFAGLPLNGLMHWYGLCINEGQQPFAVLRELVDACGDDCLARNPVAAYEMMTASDDRGYSPLAYGYSNYARRRLVFGEPPRRRGQPLRTTLCGAGLAVSARSDARAAALAYVRFVASGDVQSGLYTASGGQPGYRAAWLDEENNRISGNYFKDTLPALERAFVRPRGAGAIEFQTRATVTMDAFLRRRVSARATLAELNSLDCQRRRS